MSEPDAGLAQSRYRWRELRNYAPGLVAGIFLSRVLGEWLGLPSAWAAMVLASCFGALGIWLSSRWSFEKTWPAIILLVYIIYPEPLPQIALYVTVLTVVAFLLNWPFISSKFIKNERQPFRLHDPITLFFAAIIAIFFFLLYLSTLAPDVLAADSGELQVVATQLGVAHPPGFPLYIMIAHAFTRILPFVAPAYAVNVFSAVTSALTVSIVYLAGKFITRHHLSGLIAAVALATATTFWSQATTANVRSLTSLFSAVIILALLAYREAIRRGETSSAGSWLVLVALFMGLGLTHHVSLIFLIAIGLLFVVLADPSILHEPRRWPKPIGAALLGFLPLLYLPLRATADVRGASPQLATWPGFIEHALATGFRGDLFYFTALSDFFQRLRVMGNVLSFQFELFLLLAMIIGLIMLLRRDRALALLLGGTFAVFTLVAATYRAPQTVEYMIPAYVAAALLAGHAAGRTSGLVSRPGHLSVAFWTLFTALIILSCFNQFFKNRTASGFDHEGTSARDFAGPLLADAPADGVILAHWHWATPLWYLQEVEGLRPDVMVQFVFPEGEPYDVTWERRTREAYAGGQSVITTWVPVAQLEGLPVPEPAGEALLYPQAARTAAPEGYADVDVSLGEIVLVSGYRAEGRDGSISPGEELVVTIAWHPVVEQEAYRLYLHLVGADNLVYGQDDRSVRAAEGITLTQFRLTPRPGAPLGMSSLYIGLADADGNRELLAPVYLATTPHTPFTRNRTARALMDESGTALVGYDWDHTMPDRSRLYLHWHSDDTGFFTQVLDDGAADGVELPPYQGPWGVPVHTWRFVRGRDSGHYVPLGQGIVWTGETVNGLALAPGQSVVVDQEFHSGWAINRDLIVSVRLIGLESDGVHWDWWDLQDSVPAMGAIPTLKWVESSFVRSPHRVTVDESATTGQVLTGALTLYDSFTNRPLPILDERITAQNPWIPLCQGEVK